MYRRVTCCVIAVVMFAIAFALDGRHRHRYNYETMIHTKGRDALRGTMAAAGLSQQALAEKLGVKQPSVSAWLKGDSRPDAVQRDALEVTLGIPREWWRKPEEQERLERLLLEDTGEHPVVKHDATGTEDA